MTAIAQTTEQQQYSIESALRTLLTNVDLVASNSRLREKILSLKRKLASDQLNLAVLGQMKRGKSSFINALLGADILPTGVLRDRGHHADQVRAGSGCNDPLYDRGAGDG